MEGIDMANIDTYKFLELLMDHLQDLEGPDPQDQQLADIKWSDSEVVAIVDDAKAPRRCHRLYFSRLGVASDDEYAIMANYLKIATKSKSPLVGKVLLSLLSNIIGMRQFDQRRIVQIIFETMMIFVGRNGVTHKGRRYDPGVFPLDLIITKLSELYDSVIEHDLRSGVYVTAKLSGYGAEITINRFVGDVDIWDVYRVGNALDVWGPRQKYIDNPVKALNFE